MVIKLILSRFKKKLKFLFQRFIITSLDELLVHLHRTRLNVYVLCVLDKDRNSRYRIHFILERINL